MIAPLYVRFSAQKSGTYNLSIYEMVVCHLTPKRVPCQALVLFITHLDIDALMVYELI